MKRARVTTCCADATDSEAARARARPCPVPPDALLALLDDADVTVGQLLAGSAAVASLTADMVTRKDDSVKLACGDDIVRAARAALAHSAKRVAYCARRRARSTTKHAAADVELLRVTAKQLRVWGSPDLAHECVLEGVAVGCALTSVHTLVHVRVVSAGFIVELVRQSCHGAARVVVGDGLRVVSAAGPGLKWFEPHSRNEFSVVLAQADGSVPVWLTAGDIVVDVLSAGLIKPSSDSFPTSVAGSESDRATVGVGYCDLPEDAAEAVLQLIVHGVILADDTGDRDWCVRVARRYLSSHSCSAVGMHFGAVVVEDSFKLGMSVSADEKWLVVGKIFQGAVFVHSLPGGELVRRFGCRGAGPLQFGHLARLCFAPNGNLIVADSGLYTKRLQEVTLEGVFVRFIGVGLFGDDYPFCVAVHDDIIAVGCKEGTGPRVVLFDFGSGAVTSCFGEVGTAPGQLSNWCSGIRFTPDGSHVMVAEMDAMRVSLFTVAGVFVRCVGEGLLGGGLKDVLQAVTGEYVIGDSENNRVCVFSPDGSELVRSWGGQLEVSPESEKAQFKDPTALAAAGPHLYVLAGNSDCDCVQVFA